MRRYRTIQLLLVAIATSFVIFACNRVNQTSTDSASEPVTAADDCRMVLVLTDSGVYLNSSLLRVSRI